MTFMKFFAKHGFFKRPDNLQKCWYDDENFVIEAKFIMINRDLSLNELIRLRPKEAEKLVIYTDYFNFLRRFFKRVHHDQTTKACTAYLHEIMSRGLFRRWGLEFLLMLTHYRLPILCCEKIIDKLSNDDVSMMSTASEMILKEQSRTYDVHDNVDEVEELKNLRLTEEC
ncbi:hypothetical protein TKK_0013205 [Trichogramma kaykai]